MGAGFLAAAMEGWLRQGWLVDGAAGVLRGPLGMTGGGDTAG